MAFTTWSGINKNQQVSLSPDKLRIAANSTTQVGGVVSTTGKTSGKWYYEVTIKATSAAALSGALKIGVATSAWDFNSDLGAAASGWSISGHNFSSGAIRHNGSVDYLGSGWQTGDIIGVLLNLDTGDLTFFKNGEKQGAGAAFIDVAGEVFAAVSTQTSEIQCDVNFGVGAFAYEPPAGYAAWNEDAAPSGMLMQRVNGMQKLLRGANKSAMVYFDGYVWKTLPPGATGQILAIDNNNNLVWVDAPEGTGGEALDKLATIDQTGKIELATQAEVDSGLDDVRAVTPKTLQGKLDDLVDQLTGGDGHTAIIASENLLAGDFVSIWSDGGVAKVRKANATTNTRPAHGFVKANVIAGNEALIYESGENALCEGLQAGLRHYLSTTAGKLTHVPPSTQGNVIQYVGIPHASSKIHFNPERPIEII